MNQLSPIEADAVAFARARPMLENTQGWAAINSGTRNMGGLAQVAAGLADAFSVLPGELRLVRAGAGGCGRSRRLGPRA